MLMTAFFTQAWTGPFVFFANEGLGVHKISSMPLSRTRAVQQPMRHWRITRIQVARGEMTGAPPQFGLLDRQRSDANGQERGETGSPVRCRWLGHRPSE